MNKQVHRFVSMKGTLEVHFFIRKKLLTKENKKKIEKIMRDPEVK